MNFQGQFSGDLDTILGRLPPEGIALVLETLQSRGERREWYNLQFSQG